jgi:hypothetical protein
MTINSQIIIELSKYNKGELIPDPDTSIKLDIIFGYSFVYISRRSLAHILQKGKVGLDLVNSIQASMEDFDSIYLSDKNRTENERRLIIFKGGNHSVKGIAVVIEQKTNINEIYIVTSMIADEKYLSRKYKKLR